MTRIERLASSLEQPLLVTSLVNVRYLTGFVSSNAAVLVDPAGEATLHTDFRYAEAAAQVEGVRFEETPRALVAALAERLSGRTIGVEAGHLSLANADLLRTGGVDLVATSGAVEALRAVKDAGELDVMRRAASRAAVRRSRRPRRRRRTTRRRRRPRARPARSTRRALFPYGR